MKRIRDVRRMYEKEYSSIDTREKERLWITLREIHMRINEKILNDTQQYRPCQT